MFEDSRDGQNTIVADPPFCWNCGRIPHGPDILKEDDHYFCNKKCRAQHHKKTTPKVRKKYGPTGYIYDGRI